MDGARINKAKEALIIFLKSLPMNCYFNIYSFGSKYNKIFEQSVLNQDEEIDKALKEIENY